jgi:hypothetical protein
MVRAEMSGRNWLAGCKVELGGSGAEHQAWGGLTPSLETAANRLTCQSSARAPKTTRGGACAPQGAAERVRRCPYMDDDEAIPSFHRRFTDDGDHASPLHGRGIPIRDWGA